jgi:hypothetical protein
VWLLSAAIWRAVMPPSAALFTTLARELQMKPTILSEEWPWEKSVWKTERERTCQLLKAISQN